MHVYLFYLPALTLFLFEFSYTHKQMIIQVLHGQAKK